MGRAPGRPRCPAGGQPQALCLHARVSPGVYAFGFLFMLPQLFVNYKVRGTPSPVSPTPLGRPALTRPVSLSPDEVSGTPALEGLHLQGQCVACTSPLGPGTHSQAMCQPCSRGGALGGFSFKHRAPQWPWRPGVSAPSPMNGLPSDSHAASWHHAPYGGWTPLTPGRCLGCCSLSTRRWVQWSRPGLPRAVWACRGLATCRGWHRVTLQ